ncbi:MAG: peptidase [Tistrella sp.]|uniref:Peptidase n=1 Tax=Tistrella mobilis TaxID=171437 RepID=A0A3B9IW75_9PROT|nr:Mov34/MPN/PAD-1 family protein [Tistrella sp.]MAD40520.1 peptidase [Tistrella sp.]MBA79006.1 peptidase [Tistrella sp.]HAE51503.1 peptidase [Tistrella mobilis]|tara:strand:+ start:195 stop:677 length:483 start_codon:yes stop_codon:yes gene_type:complete
MIRAPRVMIRPAAMRAAVDTVEAAYPAEGCGLLLGHARADGIEVTETVASINLAPDPRRAFEIDPALRLRLQRRSREDGTAPVIGLYHGHPDMAAAPSAADLAGAWEAGLIWVIFRVEDGQMIEARCWQLAADGSCFTEGLLRVGEGRPAAYGPPRPVEP